MRRFTYTNLGKHNSVGLNTLFSLSSADMGKLLECLYMWEKWREREQRVVGAGGEGLEHRQKKLGRGED